MSKAIFEKVFLSVVNTIFVESLPCSLHAANKKEDFLFLLCLAPGP
jgi:hypothetical protein